MFKDIDRKDRDVTPSKKNNLFKDIDRLDRDTDSMKKDSPYKYLDRTDRYTKANIHTEFAEEIKIIPKKVKKNY